MRELLYIGIGSIIGFGVGWIVKALKGEDSAEKILGSMTGAVIGCIVGALLSPVLKT